MASKYLVKDEHTLGYYISDSAMGVLSGSVALGGHDWKNGSVAISADCVRPATADDFDRFRVTLPPDFKEAK